MSSLLEDDLENGHTIVVGDVVNDENVKSQTYIESNGEPHGMIDLIEYEKKSKARCREGNTLAVFE